MTLRWMIGLKTRSEVRCVSDGLVLLVAVMDCDRDAELDDETYLRISNPRI